MKKIYPLLALLSASVIFGGCASILNGKNQKVSVYTDKSDAKISVDGWPSGKGKWAETKVPRNLKVHQLKVEAKGYKPEYVTIYQRKKSPLHIMSFIPFGVLIYPMLMDAGPKSWNYEKEYTVNLLTKINARGENQKYIYLKNTAFDVKQKNLQMEQYSFRRYNNNKTSRDVSSNEKEVEVDNSIFTDALNDILKSNGYIDTTNKVLRNKNNTLYISATVNKIVIKRVSAPVRRTISDNAFAIAEATVDWELFDIYDQSKFKKTIVAKSGQFSSNYDAQTDKAAAREFIFNSIEDALTVSFFDFMNNSPINDLLTIDKTKKENYTALKIHAAPSKQQTLKNAQSATVSVVTKKGHGSGCIITAQGHIITNYHVIAGQKDIEVILNNGEKLKATFIRGSEDGDLALLSLDKPPAGLSFFNLPKSENYELGDEVFAIGTPQSLELSQTLSKGIISGFRKLPNSSSQLIQTDVSVSPGNSGGALVSKQGELLGIVNGKLVGFGVEGISFCIPAVQINQMLALE